MKFGILMSNYLLYNARKSETKIFIFCRVVEFSLGDYFFMAHSVYERPLETTEQYTCMLILGSHACPSVPLTSLHSPHTSTGGRVIRVVGSETQCTTIGIQSTPPLTKLSGSTFTNSRIRRLLTTRPSVSL